LKGERLKKVKEEVIRMHAQKQKDFEQQRG